MEHEHTEHVASTPEALYSAISNPANLSRFIPQVTAVRAAGDEQVEVDARYEGQTHTGSAYFRTDDGSRRVEWGSDSGYRGWMQVDADGDGSRLTLFLHTMHGSESDHDVSATLDAIRRLAESEL
jgi:carbon monoxide dehydrogenase subunit G